MKSDEESNGGERGMLAFRTNPRNRIGPARVDGSTIAEDESGIARDEPPADLRERSASDPAVCADEERNGTGPYAGDGSGGCMVGDAACKAMSYGAVNRRGRP